MNNYNNLLNDRIYKSKYYSYKKKYLQLKKKIGGTMMIRENYFETAKPYVPGLEYDHTLSNYKFIYVNMGGLGKGGIISNTNVTYILGTTGLCGCTGIAIKLNINDKNIVWLTHVPSDINFADANDLIDEILKELKYYSNENNLNWSYFNLSNLQSEINLIEANPLRAIGEAYNENGQKIASGLLIKEILNSKGAYTSREHGKGFHFKISNNEISMNYDYPNNFPTF